MATQTKAAVPSAAANGKHGHSLISDEKFRQLHELALRLGERGNRASGLLAGILADLRAGDLLIDIAGSDGVDIAAGMVGSTVQHAKDRDDACERVIAAVGGAVTNRMKKSGRVTVIFAGKGLDEPVLAEARSIANRLLLPVLFVEESSRQSPKARKGPVQESNGMPSMPVDAQDVIAMYRVAHESIARARIGSGPTQIVCIDEADAASRDAVAKLEHWLAARGLPVEEWREQTAAQN